MNKRTTKMAMVVLMVLAVALYFVSGTYARYTETFEGSGTADIAAWSVKLDGKTASETETLNLNFEVQENEYVVDGKIAPDVTAVATLELDLTGTEVAVELAAKVADSFDKSVLGESAADVVVTATTSNGSDTIGVNEIGKVTVTITVTWTNEDAHSVSDTAAAGKTLTIPVELTVKQHVLND